MDETSALIAVAEIAVAIAGFSGVATVLGGRDDASFWTPGQRLRFKDLLMHSAIGLFGALLPLVRINADGSPPIAWAQASLIWGCFAVPGTLGGFVRSRHVPWPLGSERFVTPIVLASFAGLVVLQVYNALILQSFWPYLFALVGNLAFAFVQFVRMVIPRDGPE